MRDNIDGGSICGLAGPAIILTYIPSEVFLTRTGRNTNVHKGFQICMSDHVVNDTVHRPTFHTYAGWFLLTDVDAEYKNRNNLNLLFIESCQHLCKLLLLVRGNCKKTLPCLQTKKKQYLRTIWPKSLLFPRNFPTRSATVSLKANYDSMCAITNKSPVRAHVKVEYTTRSCGVYLLLASRKLFTVKQS